MDLADEYEHVIYQEFVNRPKFEKWLETMKSKMDLEDFCGAEKGVMPYTMEDLGHTLLDRVSCQCQYGTKC